MRGPAGASWRAYSLIEIGHRGGWLFDARMLATHHPPPTTHRAPLTAYTSAAPVCHFRLMLGKRIRALT